MFITLYGFNHFVLCICQVKLLFAGERTVCDKIFQGIHSLREQCFAQVTVNSISILLNCGDAIVKSKKSPEKLFVFLDMYQVLQELKSEVYRYLP